MLQWCGGYKLILVGFYIMVSVWYTENIRRCPSSVFSTPVACKPWPSSSCETTTPSILQHLEGLGLHANALVQHVCNLQPFSCCKTTTSSPWHLIVGDCSSTTAEGSQIAHHHTNAYPIAKISTRAFTDFLFVKSSGAFFYFLKY